MDLRDLERKEQLNELIRKDEARRNHKKSVVVGCITILSLLGILGITKYCSAEPDYARITRDCVTRHYRALEYRPTPEQRRTIDDICGSYRKPF
ncbi:hypothetical protein KY363_04360 [Candidatus Woesearchaeota archaeon]|nr:hypothetical protein [Candidatus Woesearchaeota archaeon]